jgi:eukaryotic translation initiation factor 2C
MIKLTREDPADRLKHAASIVNSVNGNQYWSAFGIRILNRFEADCKVLTPIEVQYKDNRAETVDGTWSIGGFQLFQVPAGRLRWAMVYPASRQDAVSEFVRTFTKMARAAGYSLEDEPEYTRLRTESVDEYVSALRHTCEDHAKKGVAFYIIALPKKDPEVYNEVKMVANTELGVVTQCVVFDAYSRGPPRTSNPAVLANIIAGINPKLGFQNHIVDPSKVRACLGNKLDMRDTIVFGLDVCHGRTQDPDNYPSIVALCAATNEHLTKYCVALRAQSARQEIVQDIASMVREVTEEYIKANGKPPSNAIFYRDGVGEGMYETVEVGEASFCIC